MLNLGIYEAGLLSLNRNSLERYQLVDSVGENLLNRVVKHFNGFRWDDDQVPIAEPDFVRRIRPFADVRPTQVQNCGNEAPIFGASVYHNLSIVTTQSDSTGQRQPFCHRRRARQLELALGGHFAEYEYEMGSRPNESWFYLDSNVFFSIAKVDLALDLVKRQPEYKNAAEAGQSGRELLLSRPMLLFFAFFLLSASAGSGIQAFVITVMGKLWATPIATASMVLTGYMVGATGGTLVGGWVVDRAKGGGLMGFVTILTLIAMGLFLVLGLVALPEVALPGVGLLAGLAMGASRTPRDVMLKDACPPGQIGKVFGFVSAGLPLGGAITPVPLGFLIDMGYPILVLPVVAALLGLSLLCAGGARASSNAVKARAIAAE